ncbi:MAG: signal peptidase II, partial [Planctomycetales bacterium]
GIIYWLFITGEAHDLFLTIALAAITSGIIGNLYDRFGWHGFTENGEPLYAVRDWILFQWNDNLRWPNFNIADSFLVCGAIALVGHAFIVQKKDVKKEDVKKENPEEAEPQ